MQKLYQAFLILLTIITTTSWSAAEPAPMRGRAAIAQQHVVNKYGKQNVEWHKNNTFAIVKLQKTQIVVIPEGEYRIHGLHKNKPAYYFFGFGKASKRSEESYSLIRSKKGNPDMIKNT